MLILAIGCKQPTKSACTQRVSTHSIAPLKTLQIVPRRCTILAVSRHLIGGRVARPLWTGSFLRPRGMLPIGNSQERKTRGFHIGTNLEGDLGARREARCVRVWRRSDLLRDGLTEEQLEGRGYCPLRQRFPSCSIKGDKQFADTLYTTTIDT